MQLQLCSVAAVLTESSSVPMHRHKSKHRPHFQVPIQFFIACHEFYPPFIPMSSLYCAESEKELEAIELLHIYLSNKHTFI